MWPPGFARWIRFNSCRVSLIPFRWMHCTEQYSAGVTSSTDGYACTCTVQYSTWTGYETLGPYIFIAAGSAVGVMCCTVLTACFFCLAVQQRERERERETGRVCASSSCSSSLSTKNPSQAPSAKSVGEERNPVGSVHPICYIQYYATYYTTTLLSTSNTLVLSYCTYFVYQFDMDQSHPRNSLSFA